MLVSVVRNVLRGLGFLAVTVAALACAPRAAAQTPHTSPEPGQSKETGRAPDRAH